MADIDVVKQDTPAVAQNTDTAQEHMIPKTRFDEINNRLKQLEKEKAESEKAASEFSRKTAEEQGKYKELYEQSTAKLSQLEEKAKSAELYQEVLNKLLTTQRAGLPEGIIKLLDKLDPADQLEWIAENKSTVAPATQQAQPNQAGQAAFNPVNGKQVETDKDRLTRLNRQRGVISPFG